MAGSCLGGVGAGSPGSGGGQDSAAVSRVVDRGEDLVLQFQVTGDRVVEAFEAGAAFLDAVF
jgi:hypothetical protein